MAVKTVRVNFMMAEDNLKQIDAACKRLGVNRTAFINFACSWFLREEVRYFTSDDFRNLLSDAGEAVASGAESVAEYFSSHPVEAQ